MNNEIFIWMQTRPMLSTICRKHIFDDDLIGRIQRENRVQLLKKIIEFYNNGIAIDEEKSEFTVWVPNPSGMHVIDTYNQWYHDTNTDVEDLMKNAKFMIIEYDRENECILDAIEVSCARPSKSINEYDIKHKIDFEPRQTIIEEGQRYLVIKHYEPLIPLTFKGNFTRDECVRNNAEVYLKSLKEYMKNFNTNVDPSPIVGSKEESVNESNR